MYAVVGCSSCGALWLLADPSAAETATCPRCRTTHRTRRLRRLFEGDREAAREARAAMLASRRGEEDAFHDLPSGADLAERADDAGLDAGEYATEAGLDPEALAADDESKSGSEDRASVVRAALEAIDDPTEADVVAYAAERGVPADAASDLLERLVRAGEATESAGRYRLL